MACEIPWRDSSPAHDWFIIGSTDKIPDINSTTKDGDKISYT
jgi:hypothetical protein